jgi:hypothetical protein
MRYLLLSLLMLTLAPVAVTARLGDPPNPYQRITDQAQAAEILAQVRAKLQTLFGMTVSVPIDLHLVEAKEMDALFGGPYHGAEIGLYRRRGGNHEIYVMKDWSRDMCSGIMAHEFTHAWQSENCPPNQSQVIKEGFARFVEAKYYDSIGAYASVAEIQAVGDPVYGVGYKTMLAWETKWGVPGVVKLVQHISTVDEGNNSKP